MSFLNNQGFVKLLKPDFREGKIQLKDYDGLSGCVTEIDDIRIIGLGYLGVTTKQRLEEIIEQIDKSDKFTILMLHAAVDKLLGQDLAGVKKEVFDRFNDKVDYFALGHIHSRHEIDNLIFNPGAPESVHIDEIKEGKEKGFYHVQVHGKNKDVCYVNSKHRPVRRLAVNLTGLVQPSEIPSKVVEVIDASDIKTLEKPILQIILHGTIAFSSYAVDTDTLAQLITEKYLCLITEVVNNTNLPPANESAEFTTFDRSAVERHVLGQMISEEKPEWKCMQQEIVELVLRIKNDTLLGLPEEEIIQTVERLIDNIAFEEVAAEGDINNEN